MNKQPIGLIIKGLIKEQQYSVNDIAKKMGVSRHSVYLTFSKDNLKVQTLQKWADALDIPLLQLLELQQNETSTMNANSYTHTSSYGNL